MLLTFFVRKEGGFWITNCLEEDIVTQGKTLDELFANIKEAVELYVMDLDQDKKEETNFIVIIKGAI